jgi:hypothetical protein
MMPRYLLALSLVTLLSAATTTNASAEDAAICFGTADRVTGGEAVNDESKRLGHEACQRALSETSSIVQKYHLQEADFDIIGRPKTEN